MARPCGHEVEDRAGEVAVAGRGRSAPLVSLASLAVGLPARIRAIGRTVEGKEDDAIARRLLEIGFEEGQIAVVRHVAPFGGDPIAVSLGALTLAIRRSEAAFILVEPLSLGGTGGDRCGNS